MTIDKEKIVAVYTDHGGRLLCMECFGDDWSDVKSSELLTREDLERDPDKLHFCDECEQQVG